MIRSPRGLVPTLCLAAVALATPAHAVIVSPTQAARIEFTLDLNDVIGEFTFPAVMIDFTLEFDRDNGVHHGEGWTITAYQTPGTSMGSDTYIYPFYGNLIGCACNGIHLDPLLYDRHFYATVIATSGTYDLVRAYALAYDRLDPDGSVRSIGQVHVLPEPGTLALLSSTIVAAGLRRRRKGTVPEVSPHFR